MQVPVYIYINLVEHLVLITNLVFEILVLIVDALHDARYLIQFVVLLI